MFANWHKSMRKLFFHSYPNISIQYKLPSSAPVARIFSIAALILKARRANLSDLLFEINPIRTTLGLRPADGFFSNKLRSAVITAILVLGYQLNQKETLNI